LPDGLSATKPWPRFVSEAPASVSVSTSRAFAQELESSGRPFNFNDCSLGNLVFAGSFLESGRQFNRAVDDYCSLVGLPAGVIENVTDGSNAYLVAIGAGGQFSEAKKRSSALGQNRIQEIYLIDRALSVPIVDR
jgi:hypothetical protein